MRIYISGPMTGYPDLNYPAFHEAETALRDAGFEVSNPAQYEPAGESWEECLRRDLVDMLGCDAVAFLPGWFYSRGASFEVSVAHTLRMPIAPVAEWTGA